MSNRNTGIGHIAARSLIEEIAALREDVHTMGEAIAEVESLLGVLFLELRNSNRQHHLRSSALYPHWLPPDHE